MTYIDYLDILPKELLEKEYNINLLTQKELQAKYSISNANLLNLLKFYNIKKDKTAHIAAIKKTKLERYGDENFNNRNKAKETCLNKFGVENPFQNKEFIKDFQEVKRKKYGSTNNIKKNHETRIKNYGSLENSYASQVITYKATCQQKYNQNNVAKVEESKQKIKDTWHSKTMNEFINIKNKSWKNYMYDNYYFDSFPELAYYIYNKEKGYNIKRADIRLEYYFNNEKHFYLPDFEVNSGLVEIKGEHLLEQMQITGTVDNAKYECMLANNVKIISTKDYQIYIEWFNSQGYKKEDFEVKK